VIANFIGDMFARIITDAEPVVGVDPSHGPDAMAYAFVSRSPWAKGDAWLRDRWLTKKPGQYRPNTEGQTMELTDGVRVRVTIPNSEDVGRIKAFRGLEGVARKSDVGGRSWSVETVAGLFAQWPGVRRVATFSADELQVIETPQVIEVGDTVEVVGYWGSWQGKRCTVVSVPSEGDMYFAVTAPDVRPDPGRFTAPSLKLIAKARPDTANPGRADPVWSAHQALGHVPMKPPGNSTVSDEDKRPENLTSDTHSGLDPARDGADAMAYAVLGSKPKGGPVTDVERLWSAIHAHAEKLAELHKEVGAIAGAVLMPEDQQDAARDRANADARRAALELALTACPGGPPRQVIDTANVFERYLRDGGFITPQATAVDYEPPRPGPEAYAEAIDAAVVGRSPVLDWSAPQPDPITDRELRAILLARANLLYRESVDRQAVPDLDPLTDASPKVTLRAWLHLVCDRLVDPGMPIIVMQT